MAQNPWIAAGNQAALRVGASSGNTFYVHSGTGNDTNTGLDPMDPKLTIESAITACVDGQKDTIIVLEYTTIGTTIVVDKREVSIVGAPGGLDWRSQVCIYHSDDIAIFSIGAHDVRIENFYFTAGASHAAIEFENNNIARVCIKNCCFDAMLHGIWLQTGDMMYSLTVDSCFFLSSITGQGIYINDDPPFCRLQNNVFDHVQGVAIEITHGTCHIILDNVIAIPSNTAGLAITLGASTTRCIVNGNSANFGDTEMAAVPYTDSAGAGANTWLRNYKGTLVVFPN